MTPGTSLQGTRGLVIGLAKETSIAASCARTFAAAGAERAATHENAKVLPFVRAVTKPVGCWPLLPGDARLSGALAGLLVSNAARRIGCNLIPVDVGRYVMA